MGRRTRVLGCRIRRGSGSCCVLLLVINLCKSAASDRKIGPHGQSDLVLLASQVELPARGEQVAEVHVTDRFSVGATQ